MTFDICGVTLLMFNQAPNCHAISFSLHIISITYIRTEYKMQTDTKLTLTNVYDVVLLIFNKFPIATQSPCSLHSIGVTYIIAATLRRFLSMT